MNQKLEKIISQFQVKGALISIKENTQGNINSTYLVSFQNRTDVDIYLLQKINSYVFKEPYLVMKNIEAVTQHIGRQLDGVHRTLNFVRTVDGDLMYTYINRDGEKEYYRLYEYIDSCVSYDTFEDCENPEKIAYNAGKCFGLFHKYLNTFPANMLAETIPDFHNTPKRFDDLLAAIENGVTNRAFECSNEIVYLISKIKEYSIISNNLGKTIPLRVTHNDTKLNNILMDSHTDEGIAVIDLDTVMPGSILFDIGDGIRSACSNCFEDETDESKIFLNMEFTKAYLKGYFEEMARYLSPIEVNLIAMSICILTYELTLRFLTDYINNDVYFKVKYKRHNYDRFRNQFILLKDIESKTAEITKYVQNLYKTILAKNI